MVSSDTVVGIVGAVILTGAMIAVFYYESANANGDEDILGTGNSVYTVEWQEETHPATADGNKFSEGETVTVGEGNAVTYDVTIPNYTSEIHVRLAWSDDQAGSQVNAEDSFKVELLDPAGNLLMAQDNTNGEIEFTHTVSGDEPVFGEPAQKTVQARGNDTADAEAAVKAAAGSADYQVRITLLNTNDQSAGLPGVGGTVGDTSNSFDVYLGYTHWHAWETSNLPPVPAE